jgi:hypothetical protein
MFSAGGLRQGRERISFYARYYIGAARYSYSDCCRARLDDRLWPLTSKRDVRSNVGSWRDCVAKLDKEQLARNIRIEAREFLNQHCALALGLESILRAGPLKIVLQQNPAESGQTRTDANDPLRTFRAEQTWVDGNLRRVQLATQWLEGPPLEPASRREERKRLRGAPGYSITSRARNRKDSGWRS